MRKKGFTLLELVVVIIIIGILAAIGLLQFTKAAEKGRTAEAKAVLGQIRTSERAYYQEYNAYTTNMSALMVAAPAACDNAAYYFSYDISTASSATATRCTAATSKNPPIANGSQYTIILNYDTGAWSGNSTY